MLILLNNNNINNNNIKWDLVIIQSKIITMRISSRLGLLDVHQDINTMLCSLRLMILGILDGLLRGMHFNNMIGIQGKWL